MDDVELTFDIVLSDLKRIAVWLAENVDSVEAQGAASDLNSIRAWLWYAADCPPVDALDQVQLGRRETHEVRTADGRCACCSRTDDGYDHMGAEV